MAKTNQERQIKHIKDIFPGSAGSGPKHNSPSHDVLKPTQASNAEVFYKKAVNGADGGVGSVRVGGSIRVRVPSSRKKRPAPKPPEITSKQAPTAADTRSEVRTGNSREALSNTGPLADQGGRHLDRGDGETYLKPVSHTTTAAERPSKVPSPHDNNNKPRHDSTSAARARLTAMDGGTPPTPPPPPPPGDHGSLPDLDTRPLPSPPPPLDAVVVVDPDKACATSFLSDSGTASSGYQSEDILDAGKVNSPIESGTPPEIDDGFAEDGFTLEFGDEEEAFVEGRHTILYKEYQGEDFSQYLKEDSANHTQGVTPIPPPRGKYRKQKDTAPDSNYSSIDSRKSGGFKDMFNQMFTLSKQHRTKERRNANNGDIQSFSFADSKIGVVLDSNANTSVPSGEDDEALDQGLKDAGLNKSWWNTDTLSARSLKNNSDIMVRKKRSSSVPDLLDAPDLSDPNSHAYNQRDFESYRKSNMYDSKGYGTGSSKKGWWNKLTRTLKKKEVEKFRQEQANVAINPLVSGNNLSSSSGDLRL